MVLKSVKFKDQILQKDFGDGIDGSLVFSNYSKNDLEKMSFDEFKKKADYNSKDNFAMDFELIRNGNKGDEYPDNYTELCEEIELHNVKIDRIPLDDVDISLGKEYDRNNKNQEYDNFIETIKKTTKPIELEREGNEEGFIGEFFYGTMTIEGSKNHFDTDGNLIENTAFDINIKGCHLVDNHEYNLNDVKDLFKHTIKSNFNLKSRSKKPTKEFLALEHQLTEIMQGKKKKLPAKLFDKLHSDSFDKISKEKVYIASLKDNAVYQF